MKTIDDFVTLINEEVGLPVTVDHIPEPLDAVPGWDSMHLLALLAALERTTGARVSMPDVLLASSLRDIYDLTVTA
ncbi:phosphopantetheine-binding protein [Streptomyces sp. NPDC058221]|uniref:phosphopantetheine-binding protein n=1 Tax=Streptomyces sp. NPDC058221 TaxID=3346388 RepID=UPI0036E48DF2